MEVTNHRSNPSETEPLHAVNTRPSCDGNEHTASSSFKQPIPHSTEHICSGTNANTNKPVTIMTGVSLNIQGLTSKKMEYFKLRCATESIFGISLCETWLNKDIDNDEVSIKGFEIYRSDRKNRVRGGVAIYVNQSFIVEEDSILKFSNSVCEVVAVYIPKENIALISVYRPPKTKMNLFQEVLVEVECWLEQNCNDQTHSIVFGDFNFPFLKWGSYVHDDGSHSIIPTVKPGASSSCQEQGSMLIELMDANYFSQRISDCTRKTKTHLN